MAWRAVFEKKGSVINRKVWLSLLSTLNSRYIPRLQIWHHLMEVDLHVLQIGRPKNYLYNSGASMKAFWSFGLRSFSAHNSAILFQDLSKC